MLSHRAIYENLQFLFLWKDNDTGSNMLVPVAFMVEAVKGNNRMPNDAMHRITDKSGSR